MTISRRNMIASAAAMAAAAPLAAVAGQAPGSISRTFTFEGAEAVIASVEGYAKGVAYAADGAAISRSPMMMDLVLKDGADRHEISIPPARLGNFSPDESHRWEIDVEELTGAVSMALMNAWPDNSTPLTEVAAACDELARQRVRALFLMPAVA